MTTKTITHVADEVATFMPGFDGRDDAGELLLTVVSDPGDVRGGELDVVTAPSAATQQTHSALHFAAKDSNAEDIPAFPYPSVVVVEALA